jgi:hypothetical protein
VLFLFQRLPVLFIRSHVIRKYRNHCLGITLLDVPSHLLNWTVLYTQDYKKVLSCFIVMDYSSSCGSFFLSTTIFSSSIVLPLCSTAEGKKPINPSAFLPPHQIMDRNQWNIPNLMSHPRQQPPRIKTNSQTSS